MYFRFLILISCISIATSYAQRGKDGNKTVNGIGVIVNEYTTLTTDANAGDIQILVANNNLNTNGRFPLALAGGDLIMIIQMQGTTLSGSFFVGLNNTLFGLPVDSTWGTIANYNNCGNYQLCQIKTVTGTNIIELDCPLIHDFDVSGKTQIVRMPRVNDFIINTGAVVTCDAWNGSKGGIVVFEVNGNLTLNGHVNTDIKGFRGGAKENFSEFGLNQTASDKNTIGAEKGEGIGGYQNDYNYVGGRYCKGSPANAGGGGDCHNAGGGGGANGGNINTYRAVGVLDISTPNNITAFNLEGAGFANTISSGGGRGGYSASTANVSPLTNAPGASAWSGDFRIKNGGYGGRPLNYTLGKLFLGGGGGAGDMDDNFGGRGGNAGGMIYGIVHGNITGNGIITSNGENGESTTGQPVLLGTSGQDAAGGAGAGGTIVLQCYGNSSAFTCRANGGNGGSQTLFSTINSNKNQAQGPGGGGGGGYIRVSNNNIVTLTNGGTNGVTNSNAMTNFACNGATKGAVGQTIIDNLHPNIIAANDTICAGDSTVLTATSVNLNNPILEWFDAPFAGNLLFTGNNFTTPNLTVNTDYYVSQCPLHFRKKVSVIMFAGAAISVNAGANQNTCSTSNIELSASSLPNGFNGIWTNPTGGASIINPTDTNALVANLNVGNNQFVWSISNGCAFASDTIVVNLAAQQDTANAGPNQNVCATSATLNATPTALNNGSWSFISPGTSLNNNGLSNATISNLSVGSNTFVWTVTPQNNCPSTNDTVVIIVTQIASVANAGSNQTICTNNFTLNATTPTVGAGVWQVVSGGATLANAVLPNTLASNLSIGNNQFVWSVSNGTCAPNTDTVTIIVGQNISASLAGADVTQCGNSITLNATAPAIGVGTWTSLNSNINFSNINISNPTATNLSNGTNTFVYEVTGNNCPPNYDTLIVQNSTPPSQALAGADFQLCGASTNLNAVNPTVGNILWTSSNPNLIIANVNSASTAVSNLPIGVIEFYYNISNGTCTPNKDTVIVTVSASITANAGADKVVCTDTTSINAVFTNNIGVWTSIGNSQIINPTNNNSTVNNLAIGNNFLVWSVSNSSCPSVSDTVVITREPPISDAVVGSNLTVCDNSAKLTAAAPNVGSGVWSLQSGTGTIAAPTNSTSAVSNLSIGTNIFKWTVKKLGCPAKSALQTIVVLDKNNTAFVMPDTTITPGTKVTLRANGGFTYQWQPPNNLSCSNCANPVFSGLFNISYQVTITDSNGCKIVDTLNISTELVKFVEIADAFSPNADIPINRELRIHHSGLKTLEFAVYSEWGETLFSIAEGESFDKTWDGTYKGQPVNTDVFMYVITARYLDNSVEIKKGKVWLLR